MIKILYFLKKFSWWPSNQQKGRFWSSINSSGWHMPLENFNEQLLFSMWLLNCYILSLSTLNRFFIQIKRCLYTREEWDLHIWNCLGNFSIQAETAILGRTMIHAVWYSSQKPHTTQRNLLIFIQIFIANGAYQFVWWF